MLRITRPQLAVVTILLFFALSWSLSSKSENAGHAAEKFSSRRTNASVSMDTNKVVQHAVDQAHADCFDKDPFPSARKCKACHEDHYREWSVSPHAYAQMSPVANTLFSALNELVTGTVGDFCLRCHTPVGSALLEPRGMSNMDRHPTSREGVTCVVCHRIDKAWGKASGRFAIVAGGNHQVVYGTSGGEVLEQVLANPDKYGVLNSSPETETRGRDIHGTTRPLFQLTTSGFCGTCHDVVTPSGFRLEDAFSEYKASPAARREGKSCQDCHMGKIQGKAAGYAFEPIAMVGNKKTPPRKRTSHFFAGPDHSVIHPGIYPHNPEAVREKNAKPTDAGLATMREWLLFDHKAGWGNRSFEQNLPPGYKFPDPWVDPARRFRARAILNDQFRLLAEYKRKRVEVLSIGYQLSEIEDIKMDRKGLHFRVKVSNGTTGHGVPTGFDAERPIFLQVFVSDRNGKIVFQSGDLDPNGDYRDDHSAFVHNNLLPRDRQLFTLQSKFITRNIRGNEREDILPVPFSLDPLSYNRPLTRPFSSLGRPIGARKHKQNLEPGGHRWAKYFVKHDYLCDQGPYRVHVRLVSGMVPVNLVHIISFQGFDYNMNAKQIANEIVKGHVILHQRNAVVQDD